MLSFFFNSHARTHTKQISTSNKQLNDLVSGMRQLYVRTARQWSRIAFTTKNQRVKCFFFQPNSNNVETTEYRRHTEPTNQQTNGEIKQHFERFPSRIIFQLKLVSNSGVFLSEFNTRIRSWARQSCLDAEQFKKKSEEEWSNPKKKYKVNKCAVF